MEDLTQFGITPLEIALRQMQAQEPSDPKPNGAELYVMSDSSSPSRITNRLSRVEVGNPFLRRGKRVATSSDFSPVSAALLDSSGNIALTSSDVAKLGSLPPCVADGQFAATATTTSITWYWDLTNGSRPFVLRRADGTNFTVPKGSLAVTGLSSNTMYYFYPYWPTVSGCSVAWIIGTAGSPKVAFSAISATALAAQNRQDREALTSGAMTYATPNAGTSSGDATGGGDSTKTACLMNGTDIEPLENWTYSVEILPETEWVRVIADNGQSVACTLDHPLYDAAGNRREAGTFKEGDWVTMRDCDRQLIKVERFTQSCTKMKVTMKHGHLFWANGFLSHNLKPSTQ